MVAGEDGGSYVVERETGGVPVCELVLNGDVRPDAPDSLGRKLTADAAAHVVPVHALRPPAGRRAGGVVEVAALAVSSAAGLVAIIDTVREWLTGERNTPRGTGADPARGAGATSITLVMGDDQVEIFHPSTQAEQQLVEAFVRRHSPS